MHRSFFDESAEGTEESIIIDFSLQMVQISIINAEITQGESRRGSSRNVQRDFGEADLYNT